MSEFFERLGAPLRVVRTSWGGEGDRGIFLRAWQDEYEKLPNGQRGVLVSCDVAEGETDSHFGRNERREHIAQIQGGRTGYVVMCRADDVQADPRSIASFNQKEIFPISDIVKVKDCYFAVLERRIDVRDFLKGRI